MAYKTGIDAQFGFAKETTWGTPVTVTSFLPMVSESLSRSEDFAESAGMVAGSRFLRTNQWNSGLIEVGGDVQLELYDSGQSILWDAMLGTNTAGTYTPATLAGKGLTVQIGRPGLAGTVHPFTYDGCKVNSWELAFSAGEIVTLGLTLIAESEITSTALATASYTSPLAKPYKAVNATVTLAGTSLNVRSFRFSGDNRLERRYYAGSQATSEPVESDLRQYTGTLEVDFNDLTEYNAWVAQTEASLVATMTSGTKSVTLTANVRRDGSTPMVDSRNLLSQEIPFTVIATNSDASAISVVLDET